MISVFGSFRVDELKRSCLLCLIRLEIEIEKQQHKNKKCVLIVEPEPELCANYKFLFHSNALLNNKQPILIRPLLSL